MIANQLRTIWQSIFDFEPCPKIDLYPGQISKTNYLKVDTRLESCMSSETISSTQGHYCLFLVQSPDLVISK